VEKQKYSLCLEVLTRMRNAGILGNIMIVGSWCIPLYEDYFKKEAYLPPIRTRDLDLLFPIPLKLAKNADLFELLKDLGFVLDYKGEQGYITFQHPEMILEFLVPARGKESAKPFPIKGLGINAQPMRFMDALARDPIQALFGDIMVNAPHPADFALHKLLIASRRKQKEKAEKDKAQAVALLKALNESGEINTVRAIFQAMPNRWQNTIRQELADLGEEEVLWLMNEPQNTEQDK
jgi:hypothetical protein